MTAPSLPIVSLITPVYNSVMHLESYIRVVRELVDPRVELVVVDDGSTDDSVVRLFQMLATVEGLNWTLYTQPSNQGAAAARRTGLLHARGNYIALLDCDDRLAGDAIGLALKQFECGATDTDAVLFDLKVVRSQGIVDFDYGLAQWPMDGLSAFAATLERWGIHGLGVFRKSVYIRAYQHFDALPRHLENCITDDELIQRLALFSCRKVDRSKGIYWYQQEAPSTTRGFNPILYKTIFTQIMLLKFIELNQLPQIMISQAKAGLSSTLLNVWRRYRHHRKLLQDPAAWTDAMRQAVALTNTEMALRNTRKFKFRLWLKVHSRRIRHAQLRRHLERQVRKPHG